MQTPYGTIRPRSIFCVVPPQLLESIARNGTEAQRAWVVRSMRHDHLIRRRRAALARIREPFRRVRRQRRLFWPMWAKLAGCEIDRTIYDAHQTQRLPGTKVRGEGDPPTNDAAATEAYEGLGATFELYSEEYDRCSIDDEGLPLEATVHYGKGYDNAFWDGHQMVFGDGDEDLPASQRIFNRFTVSVDVIGHELTHGVTEDEAGLIYFGQSGALNESISDVFGSLVKQRKLGQSADEADWLIGEGLLTANVNGEALRSMKDPGTAYDDAVLGKDPQPSDMSGYVRTFQDNGGVHINSGIPNKAFYLVATNLGGNAWETPGVIWYETLRSPSLRRFATFASFAALTAATAGQLFGADSTEQEAVQDAWSQVGVVVARAHGIRIPPHRRRSESEAKKATASQKTEKAQKQGTAKKK
jgi:Zn-dependent metalloprotease